MTIQFSIQLPPRECSGNARGHWAKGHKATKGYREAARILALKAYRDSLFSASGQHPWGSVPIRISATFYTHQSLLTTDRYRPRDCDNALKSIKAVQDGIKDAGLIKDDGAKWVRIGEILIVSSKKDKASNGEPRVVITVEQVEP